MKSIVTYIYEKYNKIQLQEVVVKFAVENTDIIVEIPDNFLEDQINLYLDDTIINKTFVGDEYANDLFGKNADNISDVYFEYTGLTDTSLSADIRWTGDYNTNDTDNHLKKVKMNDFKFVVTFDRFDLFNDDTDNESIETTLKQIFDRCVSEEFEWPLHFILNEEDIEFKK